MYQPAQKSYICFIFARNTPDNFCFIRALGTVYDTEGILGDDNSHAAEINHTGYLKTWVSTE